MEQSLQEMKLSENPKVTTDDDHCPDAAAEEQTQQTIRSNREKDYHRHEPADNHTTDEVTSTTLCQSAVLSTTARRKVPAPTDRRQPGITHSWWSGFLLGISWGLGLSTFGIAYYLIYFLQPFLAEYFKEFDVKDSFKEMFIDIGMIFTSPGYGYTEVREDIMMFLDGTLVDIGWYFIEGGMALIVGGTSLSIYLYKQARTASV